MIFQRWEPSKNESAKFSPVTCGMPLLVQNVLKTLLFGKYTFWKRMCFIYIQFIFNISGKELVAINEDISQRRDDQI